MADLRRITSAENLLTALRSAREGPAPVPPGPNFPPSDLGLALSHPALATHQGPLLVNQPFTTDPSMGLMIRAPSLPSIPTMMIATPPSHPVLVAQQLLRGGLGPSPVAPWTQAPSQNLRGEPTVIGSEDTRCALPPAPTAGAPPGGPRPRRQTAQAALKRIGSITQGLLGHSARVVTPAGTAPATPAPEGAFSDDGLSDGGYSEGMGAAVSSPLPPRPPSRAQPRPLQIKSYDALVDPGLPPEEVRRLRRILSNRESARRSRKRKACQVSTLEDELAEVRAAAAEAEADAQKAEARASVLEADKRRLEVEVAALRRRLVVAEEGRTAAAMLAVPTSPTAGRARAAQLLQSPMRQLGFQTQAHRVRPVAVAAPAPLMPEAMPAGFCPAGPNLHNF